MSDHADLTRTENSHGDHNLPADQTPSTAGQHLTQSHEDNLARYKRLLSLARDNLLSTQASLAAKDQQIEQLTALLEEEKHKKSIPTKDEESVQQQYPRRILSRVDVEGLIWILIEYESLGDEWKCFIDEVALHEYIKRIPGDTPQNIFFSTLLKSLIPL